jgi:hypothetical protein
VHLPIHRCPRHFDPDASRFHTTQRHPRTLETDQSKGKMSAHACVHVLRCECWTACLRRGLHPHSWKLAVTGEIVSTRPAPRKQDLAYIIVSRLYRFISLSASRARYDGRRRQHCSADAATSAASCTSKAVLVHVVDYCIVCHRFASSVPGYVLPIVCEVHERSRKTAAHVAPLRKQTNMVTRSAQSLTRCTTCM